jgi:hypothetical protein
MSADVDAHAAPPFGSLDFVYMPSRDVPADLAYFTAVLGAEVVFAIDGMGTRVAMVKLSDSPPPVLLADHVDGDAPILVYRVADLDTAVAEHKGRGWKKARTLELPMGPACSFKTPGGQRFALYEATRLGVIEHFAGRRDF